MDRKRAARQRHLLADRRHRVPASEHMRDLVPGEALFFLHNRGLTRSGGVTRFGVMLVNIRQVALVMVVVVGDTVGACRE